MKTRDRLPCLGLIDAITELHRHKVLNQDLRVPVVKDWSAESTIRMRVDEMYRALIV
jgi:hypothetical protein